VVNSVNKQIKGIIQSIHNLLHNKVVLLESYWDSMNRMLQDLQNDRTDPLEAYTENHDSIFDLLKETDREIDVLVNALNPASAEIVRDLLTSRLSSSDCPDWAKDLLLVFSSLTSCVNRCINLNKACSDILSESLKATKNNILKSNKTSTAYNYYMHSRPTETGMLLDIKE